MPAVATRGDESRAGPGAGYARGAADADAPAHDADLDQASPPLNLRGPMLALGDKDNSSQLQRQSPSAAIQFSALNAQRAPSTAIQFSAP